MSNDVTLSHTMDDDIAFERVRHLPRRTQFVSRHRKLSWQFDREVRQHERDQKISHVELSRAQQAMTVKLNRLQDAKKQVARQRSDPEVAGPDRRHSVPLPAYDTRTDHRGLSKVTVVDSPRIKHPHPQPQPQSPSCFPPDVAAIMPPEVIDGQTSAPEVTPHRKVIVAKVPSMHC